MNGLLQDLRHGLRGLLRQPGYSALAVATLALGIGATTVMFTLVQGVLLSPLPVDDPDALMMVWETTPRADRQVASAPNFWDWREQNDVFEHLSMLAGFGPTLSGVDEPRRLTGRLVSANILRTVGLRPALGRDFRPDEEKPGAERVVMLSHALWTESFAADPDLVGSTIRLSTGEHMVIGIMPPELAQTGFTGDVWMTAILEEGEWLQYRGRHNITVVGRLADGLSRQQAQVQMDRIAARLAEQYPEHNEGYGVYVEPFKTALTGAAERPLTVLLASVGFVLLIACANVANLTLARAVARRGELAVCAALGAGRLRLLQRSMAESSLLALAGGTLGIGAAGVIREAVVGFVPAGMPRLGEVSINGTVLAFGIGATALTVLLAGVLPALRGTGSQLRSAMSGLDPRATGGRSEQRVRDVLVVAELSLAVVLLVGAGLFLRSLASLSNVQLGVQTDGIMTMRTYLPSDPYADPARARAALGEIIAGVRALPGVDAAAVTSHLPLANQAMNSSFNIRGGDSWGPNGPSASFRVISPGYFESIGVPLLRGRAFTDGDRLDQPRAIVVNEELEKLYFPEGAVGRHIAYRTDDEEIPVWEEIVGVVANVRHFGPASPPVAEIYQPLGQAEGTLLWFGRSLAVVVRSRSAPAALGPAMREVVRDVDPDLPVYQIQPLQEFLDDRTATPRFHAGLLSIFGILAVILASVGVYGVLSLNVRLRVREIGLRQALGADRALVIRDIVASGLKLAIIGGVIGLGAAFGLTRFVSSLLFEVGAIDPLTYVAVPVLLGVIAGLACWLPARRAARVEPVVALRAS